MVEMLCSVTGREVVDSKEKKGLQRKRMVQGRGRTWVGAVEEKKKTTGYKERPEMSRWLVQHCKMPENEETVLSS
jgi:hypothetical protein